MRCDTILARDRGQISYDICWHSESNHTRTDIHIFLAFFICFLLFISVEVQGVPYVKVKLLKTSFKSQVKRSIRDWTIRDFAGSICIALSKYILEKLESLDVKQRTEPKTENLLENLLNNLGWHVRFNFRQNLPCMHTLQLPQPLPSTYNQPQNKRKLMSPQLPFFLSLPAYITNLYTSLNSLLIYHPILTILIRRSNFCLAPATSSCCSLAQKQRELASFCNQAEKMVWSENVIQHQPLL